MKITLVPHCYLPNICGVPIIVNKLAKAFIKKGHSVNIITTTFPGNLSSREIIDGVVVDRLYTPYSMAGNTHLSKIIFLILSTPITVLKLWKLIKKNKPDIVNIQYIGLNANYILLLSYLYRFRLVVTLQGFSVQILPFLSRRISWTFNKILKRADYIISCCCALLDDAQRYVPEIRNKSTVIPNGFDPEEFEIRDGYRSLRPYIFSIGRFHKSQKGFDILIMAFRSIIDKGYDVDLIIAGDSPERKDYETLTNLLRLQERVKFFGRADRGDVVRLFNGCEFFVLPSRIEPFGIVNLEAMAAGKAIVATNVHGVPEIVKDGVNGILVKAQDDKSLANGMMKLLDDVEFRNRLAENGKRMIKDYAWDNIADRYIKIYQKILKN